MEKQANRKLIWPLYLNYKYFNRYPDWISTTFYFAIPALIAFLPAVLINWEILINNSYNLYVKLFFGLMWGVLGPYFMFRYDKAYIKFWERVKNIYQGDEIKQLMEKFDNEIIKTSNVISILWCTLVTSVIILDPSYLEIFGINGWSDPYLYIFILFIIYLVHLTALGFCGVFITIKIIYTLSKDDHLKIDVYNIDNVGGYSCFGNFSLATSLLFSTGVLFLPIIIDYSIHSGAVAQLIISTVIIIFCIAILLSFIMPVMFSFKKADKEKDRIIQGHLEKYRKYRNQNNGLEGKIEELNLYNHLYFINNVSVYPFNFSNLFKIITASLVPMLVYLIQMLIDTGSILYNPQTILRLFGS